MSTANEGVSFAQEKLNDFNDNILGPVGDALEYMAQWALIHVPVGIEKVSFSSNLSTADVGYLNVGMTTHFSKKMCVQISKNFSNLLCALENKILKYLEQALGG